MYYPYYLRRNRPIFRNTDVMLASKTFRYLCICVSNCSCVKRHHCWLKIDLKNQDVFISIQRKSFSTCMWGWLKLYWTDKRWPAFMHQSIPAPAVPIPPGNRGAFACSRCQSPGWDVCNFNAARGLGICVPWGDPRAFDTRGFESAMDEYSGKDEVLRLLWL